MSTRCCEGTRGFPSRQVWVGVVRTFGRFRGRGVHEQLQVRRAAHVAHLALPTHRVGRGLRQGGHRAERGSVWGGRGTGWITCFTFMR